MKNLLSMLLVGVMCVSMCACSGSEKDTKNENNSGITSHEWKEYADESDILIFEKDGTGSYISRDMTWNQEENNISIDYDSPNGTQHIQYELIEYGGTTVLLEAVNDYSGKRCYIDADNYDTSVMSFEKYLLENANELDTQTFFNELYNNVVRATDEYNNQIVKFTGNVVEIFEHYCLISNQTQNGMAVNSIYVYLDTEQMMELNKNDEISVVGILEVNGQDGTIGCASIVK